MNLDDKTIAKILYDAKSIAVVGAKDVPGQPVDRVGRYLIREGYRVHPVHPKRKTVWGLPAVADIASLPEKCDVIVLFRAAGYCEGHAREVAALADLPLCFWMQEGISSPEAEAVLAPLGVEVVSDKCVMVEHARLFNRKPMGLEEASRMAASEKEGILIAAPVDDTTVFTCQMCGQCCHGQGGIVVSPSDLVRITRTLGLTPEEFEERYGERRGGKLQIRCGEDGACIFFRKGSGCGVHAGKPDVCRAWPFFRGNIVDADSLEMAKDYCPGIHKDCTHAEFAREGREYLKKHGLLAHNGATEGWAVILDD